MFIFWKHFLGKDRTPQTAPTCKLERQWLLSLTELTSRLAKARIIPLPEADCLHLYRYIWFLNTAERVGTPAFLKHLDGTTPSARQSHSSVIGHIRSLHVAFLQEHCKWAVYSRIQNSLNKAILTFTKHIVNLPASTLADTCNWRQFSHTL